MVRVRRPARGRVAGPTCSRPPRTESIRRVAPDDALDQSVNSYLRGFGPASKDDIADYLGLGKRAVEPASRGSI